LSDFHFDIILIYGKVLVLKNEADCRSTVKAQALGTIQEIEIISLLPRLINE